jgi:hypothetical protein
VHQVCTCQYGIAGLHRLGSGPGPCLGGDARIVVSQRPCASRLSVYWRWRPPPCMGWAVWLQGSCCRIPEHLTIAGLAKEITGGAWVPPRITGGNGRCLDRSKGTFCQRGPSPTEMTIPRANIVEVGLLPLDMDRLPASFLPASLTPLLLLRLPSPIIHSKDKSANVHSSPANVPRINQASGPVPVPGLSSPSVPACPPISGTDGARVTTI